MIKGRVLLCLVQRRRTPQTSRKGKNNLKQVVKIMQTLQEEVQEEGRELVKEVGDCYRIGKYSDESKRHRPIRIIFKGQ